MRRPAQASSGTHQQQLSPAPPSSSSCRLRHPPAPRMTRAHDPPAGPLRWKQPKQDSGNSLSPARSFSGRRMPPCRPSSATTTRSSDRAVLATFSLVSWSPDRLVQAGAPSHAAACTNLSPAACQPQQVVAGGSSPTTTNQGRVCTVAHKGYIQPLWHTPHLSCCPCCRPLHRPGVQSRGEQRARRTSPGGAACDRYEA